MWTRGFSAVLLLCIGLPAAPQSNDTNARIGRGAAGLPRADSSDVERALKSAETTHPKFLAQLEYARANDPLLRNLHWVRGGLGQKRGPAFASPMGFITVDLNYLDTPKPGFDDNRMVVVLWHEIGHLHYFSVTPRAQWTSIDSERAAFEYSLERTKTLAEGGDCGPLRTGVFFMKLRSEGRNQNDPHVQALMELTAQPMYEAYATYVAKTPACKATPDPARLLQGGALSQSEP